MAPKERRRSPRAKVDEIVYMNFQSGNGGIVLDVSSAGMGFQAADPVEGADSLSFRLSPPTIQHIEIIGQLMWLDATRKRGGLRLAHLPVEIRSEIQLWQRQYLSLAADVEPPAEVKASPVLRNAIPDKFKSSSEAAPVGGEQGPSLPARERALKTPGQVQAIPGASRAPASALGQGPDGNAFVSTPWVPPAILPARMYSSDEKDLFSREESRGSRYAVTVSLIVALSLVAAGFLYFANRRWTGELLIRWGQSISGEQSKASPQIQPAEGTSTEAEAPTTTPLPATGATETGSSDSVATNSSAAANSTDMDAGVHASEKRPSPNQADSKNAPEATERSGLASPLGDNGGIELARARRYLQGSSREYGALAAQLLWEAVGKGNRQAELELADLYLQGEGVPKNCAQASILLKAAQNNKIPEASQRLAHLRDYGCQ